MYIIFDFDGTLVDSFTHIINKFNVIADKYSFKKINVKEITELKNLSSAIEIIQYLKIQIYKMPCILYEARKIIKSEMPPLPTFGNLRYVIEAMYAANFTLGILTSNSNENVTAWLNTHNMSHFFHFIQSDSSYFGKKTVLSKILKKYAIDKSAAFYIGDETRDIEAAKKNGISSIAVTWGFNSEKTLIKYQPDYIARKPNDLLDIFQLK